MERDNNAITVSAKLSKQDVLGTIKTRLGMSRMDYKVFPGLYALGDPNSESPVLVTSNYKLTFDTLRKNLDGLDLWILVLDTKGVNVWCASGKGTFGTKELIKKIRQSNLKKVVNHRILILPQLGASGVAAHEVEKVSGFRVKFGPVRAEDIREYLRNGHKATTQMRKVTFPLKERIVLIPVEISNIIKPVINVFALFFVLNLFLKVRFGYMDALVLMSGILCGAILTPILLPLLPGRSFAFKGFLLGLGFSLGINYANGWPGSATYSDLRGIGYMLVITAISSFLAVNFTGASTYTSLSGVVKEMKLGIPLIILGLTIGIILILVNGFMGV